MSKEELKKEKIRHVKEEEKKVFEALKSGQDYKVLVSDCYTEMDAFVDMVADNISFGALIEGCGGTGKTYRVINRCSKLDMAYTDSYTTPASFYIWLYENRNKDVLVIDDVAGFMNNDKILAFLKGALWEVNGKRIINYMTTKPLQNAYGEYIESTCEISARMIIITNHLNKKNAHIQAVLSRINYCYVDIPRNELLNILKTIAALDYDGLTKDERIEVYSYLEKNSSESTKELNIRTLFKLFQFKLYSKKKNAPEFWKVLANKVLQKDDLLVLVEELEKDQKLPVAEKVSKFNELTKKGRATYFRLKKRLDMESTPDMAEV